MTWFDAGVVTCGFSGVDWLAISTSRLVGWLVGGLAVSRGHREMAVPFEMHVVMKEMPSETNVPEDLLFNRILDHNLVRNYCPNGGTPSREFSSILAVGYQLLTPESIELT